MKRKVQGRGFWGWLLGQGWDNAGSEG